MSTEEHVFWSVTCDSCGDGWRGEAPLFDTEDDALLRARSDGWRVTDRATCQDCLLMLACGSAGHRWAGWSAAGPFPTHDGGVWQGRVRHCDRCSAADWNPPVTRATRSA